jgi:hypothetical protein
MLLSPIGPSQSSSLVIPASHEEELWSIFLRDVDPLTKVIHWPVVDQLRKRKISAKPTPTCFDALLASIYACAIVPLGEVECQTRFGHGRAVLIEHYYAATRKALFELDFLHSLDLMLVQALALLLVSIVLLDSPDARLTYGRRPFTTCPSLRFAGPYSAWSFAKPRPSVSIVTAPH